MATTQVNFSQLIDNVTFDGNDVDEVVFNGEVLWNGISYSYPNTLSVMNYISYYGGQSNNLNGTHDRSHANWRYRGGEWVGGFNSRPFWTRNLVGDWYSLIYWCPGDSNWKFVGPIMGGLDGVDDHLANIGNLDSSDGDDFLKCGSYYMGSTVNNSFGGIHGMDHGPISPELGTWYSQQYTTSKTLDLPLISDTPFFVFDVD